METFHKSFLFHLLIFNTLHFSSSTQSNESTSLIQHILQSYDPLTRPVENPKDILEVKISFYLMQIIQVDEKSQSVSLSLWFHTAWKDLNIEKNWNSFPYADKYDSLNIPVTKIWHPDIYLYNAADSESFDAMGGLSNVIHAIVARDGQVVHVPPMMLKSTCSMDITFFPFDSQSCSLKFGSWTYSGKEVNIELNENASYYLDYFTPNGEWQLISVNTSKQTIFFQCCDQPYVTITFSFVIKRKSLYHLFNLIVPCALIGFLAILGFTLPPDSPEKLSLGVTVLFSLIVFINMVSTSMPSNTESVPMLGTYFCCVMVMIASSVVSTIVINIHLKGVSRRNPKRIEGKTRDFFLHRFPSILGMKWTDPIKSVESNRLKEEGVEKGTESHKYEWEFVAFVVDKFCFILSISISVVFMLAVVAFK